MFAVSAISTLRHDAFEILFTHEPEQIASFPLDVVRHENLGMALHDPLKHALAFQQRQRSKISPIVHDAIKPVETGSP